MTWTDRITFDPAVMSGKPCIRGMRVTVGTVVGLVAVGRSEAEILDPTQDTWLLARQKFPHRQRDWFSVRFQREVPGIEKSDIRTRNVSLECARASR
jgi:hypothetical protein